MGVGPLAASKVDNEEEMKKFNEAKKNHSAWIVGSAVLRLAKICTPKCMDFQRVQVSQDET